MADSNKTQNYKLNQFIGSQRWKRTDWNEDMLIIDLAMKKLEDDKVPITVKVNNHILNKDINITYSDVGALKSDGKAVDSSKLEGKSKAQVIAEAKTGLEPTIIKKAGFNLDKSDSTTLGSSVVLATTKAVKTVWDALTSHRNSITNPHHVTLAQLGGLSTSGKAVDSSKLEGKTKAQVIAEAKSGLVGTTYAYSKNESNARYLSKTECPHAVGDIHQTTATTNPATRWHGTTWKKIEARFLIGANSTYIIGHSGGVGSIKLLLANLPVHSHAFGTHATSIAGNHAHTIRHRHKVDNHVHTESQHYHFVADSKHHVGAGTSPNLSNTNYLVSNGTHPTWMESYALMGANGVPDVGRTNSVGGNTGGATPYTDEQNATSNTTGNHTHTVSGTTSASGSGTAFSVLNPWYAVNIWQRLT